MEIEISQDIYGDIERASIQLGVDKKEVIKRALLFYLHNIAEEENLREEIKAWEKAGIEDIESFNKEL